VVTANFAAVCASSRLTARGIRQEAREIRRQWTTGQRHYRAVEAQRLQRELWQTLSATHRKPLAVRDDAFSNICQAAS
jgi:hypothetical protein